jgi:hypothetical protein
MQALRTPLGLISKRMRERRSGYLLPQLRRSLLDFIWPQMGCSSTFLSQTCKNQQVKLVGKAAEMTKNLQKISVSGNQKF